MTVLHQLVAQAASPTQEVSYDATSPVTNEIVLSELANGGSAPAEGAGCHAGRDEMRRAAMSAGKSETLDRYAADYPQGPHDQPQSMCPAFGSLRVGLRMRRTATILSGSACCV